MNFSKIICIKVYATNFTMKADWALNLKNEKTWKRERKEIFLLPGCQRAPGGTLNEGKQGFPTLYIVQLLSPQC